MPSHPRVQRGVTVATAAVGQGPACLSVYGLRPLKNSNEKCRYPLQLREGDD